jgi:hypothetical protein
MAAHIADETRSDAPRLRLGTRPLTTGEAEALASPPSHPLFVRSDSESGAR